MSDSSSTSQPWFISLTAKWSEAEGFEDLESSLDTLFSERPLPYYHCCIPKKSWHSTVFAVAKISAFPPDRPADEYMETLFCKFKNDSRLRNDLSKAFKALTVKVDKLRCFDDNTTIQFVDSEELRNMREQFRNILSFHVDKVAAARRGVEPLLQHPHKSVGPRFFGSVARSVRPSDGPHLRWEKSLPHYVQLKFNTIYFLVSDDALTNVHTNDNSFHLNG